jgi:hypothetical protein
VPDIELDIGAQLIASIETLSAALVRQEQQRQRMAQCIRQIPLKAPQANAAGVIDYPDLLAVKTGYYWGVRRLTLSGFSAGSAVVYINGLAGTTAGEPVPYAQAATFTFGRGEFLLHPGDRLVVQATGVTGYVQLDGAADCFEQWYLPHYIG